MGNKILMFSGNSVLIFNKQNVIQKILLGHFDTRRKWHYVTSKYQDLITPDIVSYSRRTESTVTLL
jgi:hypothetical protein